MNYQFDVEYFGGSEWTKRESYTISADSASAAMKAAAMLHADAKFDSVIYMEDHFAIYPKVVSGAVWIELHKIAKGGVV